MALVKTEKQVAPRDDGTERNHYEYDGVEGGGVILTGPVSGSIKLKDGTIYDVTPELIEHAPGHAGPICHHIAKIHEASGRLAAFQAGDPVHTCTGACGDEAD
jgi:hypothetical protein